MGSEPDLVCVDCNTVGSVRRRWNIIGRLLIIAGAVAFGVMPGWGTTSSAGDFGERLVVGLIVLAIFLVPALAVGRSRGCSKCGGGNLIPADSPKGRSLTGG